MNKHAKNLELDKILRLVSSYAVLEGGKEKVLSLEPTAQKQEAEYRLFLTNEAQQLLFFLGTVKKIEYFPPLGDIPARAGKGAILSCGELIGCANYLRSARIISESVKKSKDGAPRLFELSDRLFFDKQLEEDIFSAIARDNELADSASERLFELRQKIRLTRERIRERLSAFLTGEESKYLQEPIVTMRADRVVVPVKAEYRRNVKGFIHDRSNTGQTVFIEPEEVLEMNNELISLEIDEREEVERILKAFSRRVGQKREEFEAGEELLFEIDCAFARAEYAYSDKSVLPKLSKGVLDIKKGRHPLLDKGSAVPVSISVGRDYSFLLISGANTGGKTVTLKMCGLFCLMAACGLFVPAAEGTVLPLSRGVYCDIGDSQSIEENLSTFSSHMLNLKEICEEAGEDSFVLIDEPGGGTDPEEGQALARAILSRLVKKGCRGIVTTHYSALKEFAFSEERIQNGCMEFDPQSLRPLYSLKIGFPGASNALLICARLGLDEELLSDARAHLSDGAKAFEHTVRAAEESRVRSEALLNETEALKKEWQEKLSRLEKEEAELKKEREKFARATKAEAKRIVARRTEEAEDILEQIEAIFEKQNRTESDLIAARTLKNKLEGISFDEETEQKKLTPAEISSLKEGDRVYLASMETEGVVLSVKRERGIAEVQCGAIRVQSKASDLFLPPAAPKREEPPKVRFVRDLKERSAAPRECNVIGMSKEEALFEIDAFLDGALLQNLSEVRIVHGVGTGALKNAVRDYLKKHSGVLSFRPGKYGEGEAGVTIVTLK